MGTYYAYNPAVSSTSGDIDLNSAVEITFGSGTLSGVFTDDTCTLGEPSDPSNSLKMPSFTFGLATEQDNIFTGKFDALIGLAYPSMAEDGVVPFFD